MSNTASALLLLFKRQSVPSLTQGISVVDLVTRLLSRSRWRYIEAQSSKARSYLPALDEVTRCGPRTSYQLNDEEYRNQQLLCTYWGRRYIMMLRTQGKRVRTACVIRGQRQEVSVAWPDADDGNRN